MRKSFLITALLIAVALGSLLVLAFNQFKLYGRHEEIIAQTEKILFQYSNIREQIIEDMVEGRSENLADVSTAIEELHGNLLMILDNPLIPAEYKFSFLQQIDLPGLVLLLRKVPDPESPQNLLQRINEETRIIGERFMLFERLVLNHAKQKLVDFQSIVIGILALVVFLVTTLIFLTYRLLIIPVINLSEQTDKVVNGLQVSVAGGNSWQELTVLTDRLNSLARNLKQKQSEAARFEQVTACVQSILEKALVATEKEPLYQIVCHGLLEHPQFILAWIGEEDPKEQEIVPVVVDGSATMSCDECRECFSALLAAQEDVEPAYEALVKEKPVIMTDVLERAPKGPFKNTPLAGGRISSISLPLISDGKKYSVLTIYTNLPEEFTEVEVSILSQMASRIGGKQQSIELFQEIDVNEQEKNIISKNSSIITFRLNDQGKVLSVRPFMTDPERNQAMKQMIGMSVLDIVDAENESEFMVLKESLREGRHYDFKARIAGDDILYSASLSPLPQFPAERETLLVLVAPQKTFLLQPENFKIAYSAAIGQFAGSIAHELTDISNGVINYAQMLSDDYSNEDPEKREYLEKIKVSGEKIAAIIEPLLIDQNELDFSRNMENIEKILGDVLFLAEPQLKRDGITVKHTIQPTSLTFKKQQVELILFDLLKGVSEMIDIGSSNKEINILGAPSFTNGKKMVQLNFYFPVNKLTLDPDHEMFSANLQLGQELARALGGEVICRKVQDQQGEIELVLLS